jgi:hypothetical protein
MRRSESLASALWVKVLIGFSLAFFVARYLPHGGGEARPGVDTLVSSAALIMLFTTAALYLGMRYNLGLPTRIALYAVAYNALIVGVKFVLGPLGLYEVNRSVDLTSLFPVSDPIGALWTGGLVFVLYVLGYWVVYRLARSRILRLPAEDAEERRRRGRRILLPLVSATYALVGAAGVLAVVGAAAWANAEGRALDEYLDFVFSSSVSLLVAIALAGAGSLAALAFTGTAERAELIGDAALLTTFFWLGIGFLAIYHFLWVVYILTLTSIWPLKVVTPK